MQQAVTKPAPDRRQEILDAALDLFAQRGFHGSSVRQIARAVGVNEATLYHYYPSKAAILDAIIDLFIEAGHPADEVPPDPGLSLGVLLRRFAAVVLERSRSPREQKLVRLMMIEGPRLAVAGRYPFLRLMEESMARVSALFEFLMEHRKMRRLDTRLAGIEFLAPIWLYSQHQHGLGGSTQEPIDPETFVKMHVELFVRAVSP